MTKSHWNLSRSPVRSPMEFDRGVVFRLDRTNKLNSRNGENGGDNTVTIHVGENGVYTTDNTSSVDNSTHIIEIPKNDLRNGKNVIVSSGGYATSTSSSGVYTNKNIYLETNPYIKNLSLQKNSYVTSGIMVTGNTTSAFALHGTFILDIENKKGDIVVSSIGKIINYKTGAFSVKVGNIPKYMGECTLVFRNENYTENRALDREVRVPANCG